MFTDIINFGKELKQQGETSLERGLNHRVPLLGGLILPTMASNLGLGPCIGVCLIVVVWVILVVLSSSVEL